MFDDMLKKVLIVEDDAEFRSKLVEDLSRHFTVMEAEDGEQAMEKILVHKPDLILLDLLLPKVDGFAVLERLRGYPDPSVSQIPVVILSNLASNKDIATAQSLQVADYRVKSNTGLLDIYESVSKVLLGRAMTEEEKEEILTSEQQISPP